MKQGFQEEIFIKSHHLSKHYFRYLYHNPTQAEVNKRQVL
jgi:hypothetical protein